MLQPAPPHTGPDQRLEFLALWSRASSGEGPARERLCRELGELALRYAIRQGVPVDDREDLCQEVTHSIVRSLAELPCPRNHARFVWYRTLSLATKLRRQATRYRQSPEPDPPEVPDARQRAPWRQVDAAEGAAALRDCLERLPDRDRRVVGLRYSEGRGVQDIARLEGRTDVAIYKRLKSAFASLLACLRQKGVEA